VIAELNGRIDVLEAKRAVLLQRLAQRADQPDNDHRTASPPWQSCRKPPASVSGSIAAWTGRSHGVQVVPPDRRDPHTAQTPGMHREAAVGSRTGANALWAGTVTIEPDARTGAHHHGDLESVIYVVSGRARMRWGDRLEFTAEAGPGVVRLRAAVRAAPGDERQRRRAAALRAGPQWPAASRRRLDIDGVADPEDVPWRDSLHLPDGA
jgi:uncharacterized RmlC-like cupin family protein